MRDPAIFETVLLIKSEDTLQYSPGERKAFFISLSIADCNVYYGALSPCFYIALPSVYQLATRARSC